MVVVEATVEVEDMVVEEDMVEVEVMVDTEEREKLMLNQKPKPNLKLMPNQKPMPLPKLTLMLMPTMDEEAMEATEDMEGTEVTVMVGMDVSEEVP